MFALLETWFQDLNYDVRISFWQNATYAWFWWSTSHICHTSFWNGLPKDLHQFANPRKSSLNFTSPLLALSSTALHSWLKTELFKLSYPDSTLAPPHDHHHHRLPCIVAPCCLISLSPTDFDLAPELKGKSVYCELDLIERIGWLRPFTIARLPFELVPCNFVQTNL